MYKKTETIIEKLKQIIKDVVFKENFYINETGINRKSFNPEVEKTRNQKFGDFSTNFLAKTKVNKSVIDDYKKIFVAKFSKFKKYFEKVEFVEPSFINFTLAEGFLQHYIFEIIDKKDECDNFNKKKTFYNLEFVSANPTGLLHLGHARNAAYGDTLVNI
jgi:arginyl-tRNA synthetase